MELSAHHAEDGIDNDVNGYGGWLPPVPHGSHAFLVVAQEIIRQSLQSRPGEVTGLETSPVPSWERGQFTVAVRTWVFYWFSCPSLKAIKRKVSSLFPPHKIPRYHHRLKFPSPEHFVFRDSGQNSKIFHKGNLHIHLHEKESCVVRKGDARQVRSEAGQGLRKVESRCMPRGGQPEGPWLRGSGESKKIWP